MWVCPWLVPSQLKQYFYKYISSMLLHAAVLLEPGPVLVPRQHPGPAGGGVAPHDVPRVIVHHRLGPGLTLHRQPLVPGGRWLSVISVVSMSVST